MSHDLIALRLPEGAVPEFELERRELLELRAPTSEERVAMDALVDALRAVDPRARRTVTEFAIELDDGRMLVTVFPDEVGLTMPWISDEREARITLARAAQYVAVLRGLGWTVWDPQSESVVDEDWAGEPDAETRAILAAGPPPYPPPAPGGPPAPAAPEPLADAQAPPPKRRRRLFGFGR